MPLEARISAASPLARALETLRHRRARRWLGLHFAGRLGPRKESRLRRHLGTCSACRDLHGVLSLTEGRGPGAAHRRHARMERALFGPADPAHGRGITWRGLALAGTLAGALAAVALVVPRLHEPEFRAKGAPVKEARRHVSVAVFSRGPLEGGTGQQKRPLVRVEGAVTAGSTLAFAYTNLTAARHDRLMLFALDDHYTVYWFYPAWTDPRKNPRAVPITQGRGKELLEEVGHDFRGRRLHVFALFSRRRDLSVREVEVAATQLRKTQAPLQTLATFPVKGTVQHVQRFNIKGAAR